MTTRRGAMIYFLRVARVSLVVVSGDFWQSQRVFVVRVGGRVSVTHELELSVPHVEFEFGTTVFRGRFGRNVFLLLLFFGHHRRGRYMGQHDERDGLLAGSTRFYDYTDDHDRGLWSRPTLLSEQITTTAASIPPPSHNNYRSL